MSSESSDDQRSPWSQPSYIAAALVVVLVLVAGVILAVTNAGGDEDAPDTASPSPTSTQTAPEPTPSATPSSDSVCGLTGTDPTDTVVAPPQATWTLVGTTAVPTVEGHGPGVVEEDGFRSCYSRAPTGALTAAANLAGLTTDAATYPRIFEELTALGPGRDAALAQEPTLSSGGSRFQIAGFRMLQYTPERAKVDIALRVESGALASFVVDLMWEAGDWKLDLAPNGELRSELSALPSLAGYVAWGGA